MARALDATQSELVRRSHIAPVTLVKLTTFSKASAEAVDKIFYLSNVAVRYDYGNLGIDRDFLPVITGGGQFVSGFQHVPEPENLAAFGQALDLEVSNLPINGKPFVLLLQEHNLEGAQIEISQLLLPEIAAVPLDLSTSHVGDEHTVLFRGRINRLSPIQEFNFTIECRADLPQLANEWIYTRDPKRVFQRDIGARLPRVYGKAVHTRLVTFDVGLQGTMVDAISISDTGNKLVSDGSIIPKGIRTFKGEEVFFLIDDEVIEMRGVEGTGENTFDIVARAQKNTIAAAHVAGATFQVIRGSAQSLWIISDQESSAVPTLFTVNQVTGLLTRMDPTLFAFTIALADSVTVPGRKVTSMSLIGQEEFSQQPNSITGGIANQEENAIDRIGKGHGSSATYNNLISGATAVLTFQNFGTIATQTIIVDLTAATQNVEVLVGAVVIGTVAVGDIPGAGSDPDRFEFTTTETGNAASVRAVSSGNVRLHNIERRATINGKILIVEHDIGSNTNSNITGCEGNDLNDENSGTFCDFTTADNQFVEVSFFTPALAYTSQRVYFIARIDSDPSYAFEVSASEHHRHAANLTATSTKQYQFQTDKIGELLTARTFTSEDLGRWFEIERDVMQLVDSPPPGGFGGGIFANVSGVLSPGSPVDEWAEGEDFDDGTWNVAGTGASVAAETSDKIEGIASQKISITEPVEIFQTEATTNWSAINATVAVVTDEGHLLGSGAIEGTSNALTGDTFLTFSNTGLDIDMTDLGNGTAVMVFDFKIKKNGSAGPIQFRFGSSSSNVFLFEFDYVDFEEDTWVTIVLDKDDADSINGTPDETGINRLAVVWNHWDEVIGAKVYFDNIRIYRDNPIIIQNNAVGGNDLTAPSEDFRIWLRADGGSPLSQAVPIAFISDDVGTGTTLTPDYQKITFPAAVMAAWDSFKQDAVLDQGTIVITNIRTVRFEFTIPKKMTPAREINPRFPLGAAVYVDNLEISKTLGNAYKAGGGAVMTHPADIIRHWIEEVGGELLEVAGYDALFTSLGSAAVWGFDARGMGFTWAEVLARMAYEARCNVIPVETASGRVWKILAADNGYGFGAPPSGSIIGNVEGLVDEGRAIEDLASFFTFRYRYDTGLQAGGSEEGFSEILLATPNVSDVPITKAIISAAADRFGAIEAQPVNYRATGDKATAQDTSGYLVQERIANKRRVFRIGNVPWFDALPRDVGDIVSVTPPWDTVAVTCRIIQMAKLFDANSWDITAIEVLETGTRT